jgi:hypothetical protein
VGDRVELDGVGLAAQAQGLQAGGAATHEWIEQAGRVVGEGLPDQILGLLDGRAVAVFDLVPVHDDGDEVSSLLRCSSDLGAGTREAKMAARMAASGRLAH